MADKDPAEQQLDRTPRDDDQASRANEGLEDSIDKAVANQSVVTPDDYPEKAVQVPDA